MLSYWIVIISLTLTPSPYYRTSAVQIMKLKFKDWTNCPKWWYQEWHPDNLTLTPGSYQPYHIVWSLFCKTACAYTSAKNVAFLNSSQVCQNGSMYQFSLIPTSMFFRQRLNEIRHPFSWLLEFLLLSALVMRIGNVSIFSNSDHELWNESPHVRFLD